MPVKCFGCKQVYESFTELRQNDDCHAGEFSYTRPEYDKRLTCLTELVG